MMNAVILLDVFLLDPNIHDIIGALEFLKYKNAVHGGRRNHEKFGSIRIMEDI